MELRACELSVRLGRGAAARSVLTDVSASFSSGQLAVVTGPSGSGKTTLLCSLGTLVSPVSGSVWLDDVQLSTLPPHGRARMRLERFGFVFQQFRLFTGLSVLENVQLPLELTRKPLNISPHTRASTLLSLFSLQEKSASRSAALSGGEQQRVAVARALANDPDVLLADEPTASLDEDSGRSVMHTLREQAARRIVVVVSHDKRVWDYADTFIHLRNGRTVGQCA